jgi:cytochrome P450
MHLDPFSDPFLADPYPHYAALRCQAPCHHDAHRDVWLVSRHDDVVGVLSDPRSFSSSGGAGWQRVDDPERGGILVSTDPPRHTALRRFVQPAFSAEAMGRLGAFVERAAAEVVERAVAAGSIEAVGALAEPLPVLVSAELLGLPLDDAAAFPGWSDAVFRTMGPLDGDDGARTGAIIGAFVGWLMPVLQEGRLRPGLAQTILADARSSGTLSEGEAVSLIVSLFAAGIDTTVHAIGNGLAALAAHPAAWDALRASPQLVPSVVEEMLRYDAPIQAFFRTATRDVTIAGVAVPAGARVMALFGSANRDTSRWTDADAFRVDRQGKAHLAFGTGIHLCLGAPLARLEMAALLRGLAGRVRRLELAGDPVRRARAVVRGFARLPLRLSP